MFTGDNVLGHGSAAVELLPSWMQSLRVMASHSCTIGHPAHREVIRNLPAKINLELQVKERREKKVLQALARVKQEQRIAAPFSKGSVTVRQLVSAMYGEQLDDQVREKAIEPFTDKVLRKLAGDGKVAFELKAGQRKWFALLA